MAFLDEFRVVTNRLNDVWAKMSKMDEYTVDQCQTVWYVLSCMWDLDEIIQENTHSTDFTKVYNGAESSWEHMLGLVMNVTPYSKIKVSYYDLFNKTHRKAASVVVELDAICLELERLRNVFYREMNPSQFNSTAITVNNVNAGTVETIASVMSNTNIGGR